MTTTLADRALAHVLEHGPLPLERLHLLAVERGTTRSRQAASLRTALARDARFVMLPDGRYEVAPRLLRGSIFTTRVRPGAQVLWSCLDLEPLELLPTLPLSRGGELRRGVGATPCWLGPPGWLPDRGSGVVGLRWDGSELHVAPCEPLPADGDAALHARQVLARHVTRRPGPDVLVPVLGRTVLGALVEDPQLFDRPLPPLSELLPLPGQLRPQDSWFPLEPAGQVLLQVPVAPRVHAELGRRADLLGERLPDYVAMLLSAAADRCTPPEPSWHLEPGRPADEAGEGLAGWER